MQILLVEDDPNLAKILLTIFKNSSYKTVYATNIADGLKAALSQSFNIMIFDWMLQDETGVELLREIREYDITTPVLMLTAVSAAEEKVFALDLGADDYLTKPFLTEELLARFGRLQGANHRKNRVLSR
ncbi:MAG TPA: response regulator [Campylobacterales bacterium]|nr:response regulator [Campylobacterales bacterium]